MMHSVIRAKSTISQDGHPHIWVVDSISREGFDCSSGEWEPVTEFAIKDSPIRMSIAELDLP